MFEFIIYGKPKGKESPRQGSNGAFYIPNTTRAYQKEVRAAFLKRHAQDPPLTGGVRALVWVYFPCTGSKAHREEQLAGREFPTKKPDLDNISKMIFDALNGLAYQDDRQITTLTMYKRFGEVAKVKVRLEPEY